MKHPPELKTKFLELRARGLSYGQIAEAIGVSKPTLIQWGKAMAEEIADLQAAERELVREKLLGDFEQWLGRQVHHFNRLDAEFGRREFKYSPTESVFRMMMASRKLLDRYFFDDDKPSRRGARTSSSAGNSVTTSPDSKRDKTVRPPDSSLNHNRNLNPPALEGEAPRRQQQPPVDDRQSPTCDPSSAAPSKPCVQTAANSASMEMQNPAKTLPFPCQNLGPHKPNLSPVTDEGTAMYPDSAEFLNHNRNLNHDLNHPFPPPRLCVETVQPNSPDLRNTGSGAIGNSNIHGYWNPPPGVPRTASADSQPSTLNSEPRPDPFGLEGANPFPSVLTKPLALGSNGKASTFRRFQEVLASSPLADGCRSAQRTHDTHED